MANFPDAATVRELQAYGVRTVVLHLGLTEGTPQAGAQRKPIAGLPLEALPAAGPPGAGLLRGGLFERQLGAERGLARAPAPRVRLSPALAEPDDAQRREREQQARGDQPER